MASDKLAEDIVMLDLRQVASFADYFVIMSAESARQIEHHDVLSQFVRGYFPPLKTVLLPDIPPIFEPSTTIF